MTYVFIQNDMSGLSGRSAPLMDRLEWDEPRASTAWRGNRVGCNLSLGGVGSVAGPSLGPTPVGPDTTLTEDGPAWCFGTGI